MARYKHSSDRSDWVTPMWVLDLVTKTLGHIDLDPASSERVNNRIVKAKRYFDEESDGLKQRWHGRVYLNPPYGKIMPDGSPSPDGRKGMSSQAYWTQYLAKQIAEGNVDEAVLMVSSATSQSWFRPLWRGLVCFPFKRIRFLDPVAFEPGPSNQYNNAIFYFGTSDGELRFAQAFRDVGTIATDVFRHDAIRRA